MPVIQFRLEFHTGFAGVARNGLRRSRILAKLRSIKRAHPTLGLVVKRGDRFISVEFADVNSQTVFVLIWPADYPRWEVTNDIS